MKNKFIKVVAMIMFFALTTICLSGCSTEYYQLTKQQEKKIYNKYASVEVEYKGYKLVYDSDKRTSTSEISQEDCIYVTGYIPESIYFFTGKHGEKNIREIFSFKFEILKNGEHYATYDFRDNEIYMSLNNISIYDDVLNDKQKYYDINPLVALSCSFDGKLFILTSFWSREIGTGWLDKQTDLFFIPMLFVFDETNKTFKYCGFLEDYLEREQIPHEGLKIIKE